MNIGELSTLVQNGKAKDVKIFVQSALDEGISAKQILNDGLIAGMMVIGEKFKNNQVYVPEVLIAARAMSQGVAILKPYLTKEGAKPAGTAIICTVKGDLHDIGKNLVKMMMEGVGIECIDLGVDVSGEQIVSAVNETGAKIVCLSSLLTTTMAYQKTIIEELAAAGVRNNVKVMIGGAPVTQEYADEIGADAYTKDAAEASEVALDLLKAN